MVLFLQELQQRVAVGADGLVCDHVGEVVDAVELLGGLVQALADVVLQFLRHPDDALDAALGVDELLGGDEVTAVAHVARGLYAAAGAGGQLAEGHAGGGHARVFTVDDDEAVGHRLDAGDALEAAAGGHRVFHDGVQRDLFDRAVRRVLDGLVDRGVAASALVEAAFLQDGLGRAVRVQVFRIGGTSKFR